MSMDAFSQIDKGKFVIDLKGGFSKTFSESGVNTNMLSGNAKISNITFTAGYALSNNFIIGFGADYFKQKEQREGHLTILNYLSIQEEMDEITSEVIMPSVYLGYYKKVIENLYFTTTFGLEYGNVKTTNKYTYVSGQPMTLSTPDTSVLSENSTSEVGVRSGKSVSHTELFMCNIKPALTYYVFPHLGLNLEMGGLNYSLTKWDLDLAQWNVNFNPSNWKLGVQLCF
jgi:hypothetical protein